jgi:cytochrome c biogenesis factor
VVQSVHSFGDNPELAMMFSIFMVVILVVSFGLVIYRLPLLRASNELDSWASREAAVPRQQLDPAVLRLFRAVRDDVPRR